VGRDGLTIDAIVGITDIVEGLHHAIINLGGEIQTLADVPEMADLKSTRRTHGITGLGYRSIRSIYFSEFSLAITSGGANVGISSRADLQLQRLSGRKLFSEKLCLGQPSFSG
jgi:hypothetical protein